jgi:hypothetical protein
MMPNPPPPPPEDKEQFKRVQRLLARLRCAVCGRPYDPAQCTVVDRREDAWVFSTNCPRCRTAGYVMVVLDLKNDSPPALPPPPDEREAARSLPPITADEVIDLHFWLEAYTGDLESLIVL